MLTIPLTEADKAADRRLDTEVFGKQVDEAQKTEETYLASIVESGNGRVRGVGSTETKAEVTEAQVANIVAGAFGRTVKGA
jgi:predicted RNA-binding protein with PUA domain